MTVHKLKFRPKARMVAVLGEHLISDQAVGLIELVKNSYDADATDVVVELTGLEDPANTTVTVRDNGCGMSLQDITEKWLCPATGHKDRAKVSGMRTALGRLPLGEKGVGRFAVHQIGKTLELVTRSSGNPELVLQVDWDKFDSAEEYLDTLAVEINERPEPVEFRGEQTGTKLVIRQSRAAWGDSMLRKVYQTLRRLQSPLREDDARFNLSLRCPSHTKYENIDPSDILERAHYEFRALVDSEGACDFEYQSKHPAVVKRNRAGTENLAQGAHDDLQGTKPSCGPFYLNFFVWDRTTNFMQASGVSREELNAMCGVSVFRDHMRVLPYGEAGNDWLFLDQERINDPTERLANNQIIGYVQFDQSQNLLIRDKTNREGLIENDAFLDLRALVKAALRVFMSYWRTDRPKKQAPAGPQPGSIDKARRLATAIQKSASPAIKVTITGKPESTVDPSPDTSIPIALPSNASTEEISAGIPPAVQEFEILTQVEAAESLINNIDGVERAIKEKDQKAEVILDLAATGLAAERVVHEFGRHVRSAVDSVAEVRALLRPAERSCSAMATLETSLLALRNEFHVLAPYVFSGRAQPVRNISATEIVRIAMSLNKESMAAASIHFSIEGPDFDIRVRPASMVQVIDNLVHNAWNWVRTLSDDKPLQVGVILDAAGGKILVADTGPGVSEESSAHIFDPFFSMRAGGRGLGLYISRELLHTMNGRLRLAAAADRHLIPSWATGAVFVVEIDR